MDRIIPYGRQHITEDDLKAVENVLLSDYLTTGPKVREFEENFANYVDSKYGVAVCNGTAALHLCTSVLGVSENSKVITTPITFSASANCVRYCGGHIDFVDIDSETHLIDLDKLRTKLESSPHGTFEGIIPVDFAGYPVDLERMKSIAEEFNLWILEDACHAPGGGFVDSNGIKQKCGNGNFADLSIFSFHPVKHIACGEGGMITTNNERMYNQLISLRSHGMRYQGNSDLIENHGNWYMELHELGYNYRMPDILCALGISQLSRAEQGLKRRKDIAKNYLEAFANTAIIAHSPKENINHAYHLFVIEVNNRKELYDSLRSVGIYAQVHYIPIHYMPYYKNKGNYKVGDFPIAEGYYERCISLPMYPTLTSEEQEFVITQVLKVAL